MKNRATGAAVWLLGLLLAGCLAATGGAPEDGPEDAPVALPAPADALPAGGAVAGWSPSLAPRTYDRDTLYDFMNGAADLYYTFGFESLAVGEYEHADGGTAQVAVYRTRTDADAYGLYAHNAYGAPVELGVDGRGEGGIALAFWQQRSFVQIVTRGNVPEGALRALGEAVAGALPAGGVRPALVEGLPAEGLDGESVRFFREQMAFENTYWLGSENVLQLGPDVEGVVASYAVADGARATLVLVRYPDSERAEDAYTALQGAAEEKPIAARTSGRTLGAVFGAAAQDAGAALLDRALADGL